MLTTVTRSIVSMKLSSSVAVISVLIPAFLVIFKLLVVDHRVYDLERQDKSEQDGRYTRAEYMELMHMLAEVNLADPNGHQATLASFDELKVSPKSIMEIGFGLGHFSIMLAKRYPNSTVTGIDAHQLSVDSANEYLRSLEEPPVNVRFESRRESQLNEAPKSVDVITTTLVNHHILPDEQFVDFLKRVAVIGRHAFIFNDMHRSLKCVLSNEAAFLALRHVGPSNLLKLAQYMPQFLAKAITRYEHIFTEGRPAMDLFIDGGRLSMKRSFSIPEYERMFALAGYPAGALKCTQLDKWYETLEANCRVVCVADLTWSA